MHEWALAEAVVEAAIEIAKKEDLQRVTEVCVHVGELQRISVDFFRESLDTVMPEATRGREELFRDVKVSIEKEEASFRCRACQHEYGHAETAQELSAEEGEAVHFIPELSHSYLRCPQCESADFEVLTGRGVRIAWMEGE